MPLIHDPNRRVCQTCNRILEREAGNWTHPLNAPHDHEPVPKLDTEVEPEEHCDFCFVTLTEGYLIPANTFEMMPAVTAFGITFPAQISVTNWLACTACAGLIDADRWSRLTTRAISSHVARNGPMDAAVRQMIGTIHARLRENITGPLRRVP